MFAWKLSSSAFQGILKSLTNTREAFLLSLCCCCCDTTNLLRCVSGVRKQPQVSLVFIISDLMNRHTFHPISAGVFLLSSSYCIAVIRRDWTGAGGAEGADHRNSSVGDYLIELVIQSSLQNPDSLKGANARKTQTNRCCCDTLLTVGKQANVASPGRNIVYRAKASSCMYSTECCYASYYRYELQGAATPAFQRSFGLFSTRGGSPLKRWLRRG